MNFKKSSAEILEYLLSVEQLQILAPDVVALQEIQSEAAFQELVAALPDYDGLLNQDPGAFEADP